MKKKIVILKEKKKIGNYFILVWKKALNAQETCLSENVKKNNSPLNYIQQKKCISFRRSKRN